MGFFSDIVDAIEGVIKSIMRGIGSIVKGLFGDSPIMAALIVFAIAWFFPPTGAGFMEMWTTLSTAGSLSTLNFALIMLEQYPFLMASAISLLNVTIAQVVPGYNRFVGFVSGVLFFCSLATIGYSVFSPSGFSVSAFSDFMVRAVGPWYSAIAASLTLTSIYLSTNEAFVNSFAAGVTLIPGVVADVADVVVSSALSSASSLFAVALIGFGVYFLASREKPPVTARLEVSNATN